MVGCCGGLMAACGALPEIPTGSKRLERIGLGFFTIPHRLENDFAGAMKRLAEIG